MRTYTHKNHPELEAQIQHVWHKQYRTDNYIILFNREEVIDSGATVVIRPDSGDPVSVLCGYGNFKDGVASLNYSYTEHQIKGVLNILAEKFGTTTNSKGYKVINNVKVIQGDGVNPDSIKEILERMEAMGFSATNIAFGMGWCITTKSKPRHT